MKKLALVGAGPGLGMAVARRFGAEGFHIGLIARDADRLRAQALELSASGVNATALPADVRDRAALTSVLDEFGPVDVLEYSPGPKPPFRGAADVTVEAAAAQLDVHLLGAVAAVRAVLPGMLSRGDGVVLLTTGVSSVVPTPFLADVGLAMAALRNWTHTLHAELQPRGVFVGAVTIARSLASDVDSVADRYYDLYARRDRVEEVVGDVDEFRLLLQNR